MDVEQPAIGRRMHLRPEGGHGDAQVVAVLRDIGRRAGVVELLDQLDAFVTRQATEADLLVHVVGGAAEAELVVLDHLVDRREVLVQRRDAVQVARVADVVRADLQAVAAGVHGVVHQRPVAQEPAQVDDLQPGGDELLRQRVVVGQQLLRGVAGVLHPLRAGRQRVHVAQVVAVVAGLAQGLHVAQLQRRVLAPQDHVDAVAQRDLRHRRKQGQLGGTE